ncbi:MAG: NAD(P)-dependent oxidoreductase [Planctomycetota bacterium]
MTTVGLLFDTANWDLAAMRAALPEVTFVSCDDCRDWDEATYADRLRDFDAVVGSRSTPRLPDALIGDRGRLKLFAYCHGSVRAYISQELIADGLITTNWGDQVAGVAEAAMCLVLACLKQLKNLDRFIRADWSDDRRIFSDFPATLIDRDVGLYGFGPIGRHMARFLEPYDANIAIYDPYAEEVPAHIRVCDSLEELFATCQVISIHCGLNDQTRGSVGKDLLDRLPQGGVLVNTARGKIVVEEDLVAALEAKRLIAGLDVIENERRWAQSPIAGTDAYLTGHVLSSARRKDKDTEQPKPKQKLQPFVLHNLAALASGNGDYLNVITPEAYALKT